MPDNEDAPVVPEGDAVECNRCDRLYDEIMGSFRVSLDKMKDIAAKGKGQDYEAEHDHYYIAQTFSVPFEVTAATCSSLQLEFLCS